MNKKTITVELEDLEHSERALNANPNVLLIDNNIFTVDCIKTLLQPEIARFSNGSIANEEFAFSYDDGNICCVISVIIKYKPTSFYKYLELTRKLNDSQLNTVYEKMMKYISETVYKDNNDEQNEIEDEIWGEAHANVDKLVFNEALVFILNGINKEDCETAQKELWDGFENWRKKMIEINNSYHESFNSLYDTLADIKLEG